MNKPKPNTRFLRNIIKDTDSHNAALLAKEAADSKARLANLETKEIRAGADIRKRQLGHITAHLTGRSPRRDSKNERPEKRKRRSPSIEDDGNTRDRKDGGERQDRAKKSRGDEKSTSAEKSARTSNHKRRRSSSRERSERHRDDRDYKSRVRSRSPREHRDKEYRHRHYTSSRKGHDSEEKESGRRKHRHRSLSSDNENRKPSSSKREQHAPPKKAPVEDDSDPLDEIIGPRPPPKIRSRGRGTTSEASGIDSRFSSTYDPTADVQLDFDEENDWEQALEALRDRQKYKSVQGDRLRAAGFTEDEVAKWESGGEKKEEDVKWAKKGEGREWDRGKVFQGDDDDAVTSAKGSLQSSSAAWGRLKGT